jgi:hypothetical protein
VCVSVVITVVVVVVVVVVVAGGFARRLSASLKWTCVSRSLRDVTLSQGFPKPMAARQLIRSGFP